MDKKRGRPKHIDRISIDEALLFLKENYHIEYAKGTIYNNISRGKLKNYGTYVVVQLDRSELINWQEEKTSKRRQRKSFVA